MTNESSATSHLSVAMATQESDKTETTGVTSMISSAFGGYASDFYMRLAVVVMGVVGTAGNGLVLYALFASKQHKKHMLIVNQNILDLFGSFFLSVTFGVHLFNIPLSGELGHWLCAALLSDLIMWWGTNGSMINLAFVTIDRYLMIVHPAKSKRWLRPWVIYSACALSWFVAILWNTVLVFSSAKVIDGICRIFVFDDDVARIASQISYIVVFYFIILAIFIFCYWRILLVVRRQARVMASHSAAGPSNASQVQSHRIQSNVIKTMILVSALYIISWMPLSTYSLLSLALSWLSYSDSRYYAILCMAFLYTTTNPFIYATKFNPVKKILLEMIPCKKTPVEPTALTPSTITRTTNRRPAQYKERY